LETLVNTRLVVQTLTIVVICLALGASGALAATYSLGTGNSAISGYPSPYGTVQVTLPAPNSSTANVVFTAGASGSFTYLFGGEDALDVNVNAGSFTCSTPTFTQPAGFSAASFTQFGTGNVSTFGSFNLRLKAFDGYTHSVNTATFVLTKAVGTWASDADVLALNSSGNSVAAHVFVTGTALSPTAGAVATGYAAGQSADPVPPSGTTTPEPASLLMMALGLSTMGAMGRRRLRRA